MEAKLSKLSQSGSQTQKMSRTASKASVTPSQMSERTRMNMANPNRDPLDSLSRMTQRQMAERRSGLQDVDDDYLRNVVYAYAGRTRQAAAERNEVRADMIPAGVPTMRPPYRPGQRVAAGAEQTRAPSSETAGKIQQNFDAVAAAAAAVAAPGTPISQSQVAQERMMAAQPVGVAPSINQEAAAAAAAAQQQKQQNAAAAAPNAPQIPCGTAGAADPEMYTTCPNCRATLYLVRNVGDPSPYGTQPTPQQQQQLAQQAQQQQQLKQSQEQPPQQSGTIVPAQQ